MITLEKNPFAVLLLTCLLAGCAAPDRAGLAKPKRATNARFEVFYIDEAPSKKHTEIAAFTFRGTRADQSKAIRYFTKEAKRLGADGVVIYVPGYDNLKGGRLGLETDVLFKASAFVYTP